MDADQPEGSDSLFTSDGVPIGFANDDEDDGNVIFSF